MVRKTALSKLSISELQELLNKKLSQERKRLPKLKAKRKTLQAQLDELNQEIEAIGGAPPKRRKVVRNKRVGRPAAKKRTEKKRGTKRVTLPEALAAILSKAKGPMSPVQLANQIKKRRHPSAKSKSLRLQITTALSKRPEFKRVGRGQYQLKK